MNTLMKTIVVAKHGQAVANSRDVADYFGKRHDHVLRDIDILLAAIAGSPDLGSLFSEREDYHEAARKMVRSFDMTRDGFTLLAMGFTGKKALRFKLDYIAQYNEMEETLKVPPKNHRTAPFSALPAPSQSITETRLLGYPFPRSCRFATPLCISETSPLSGPFSRTL